MTATALDPSLLGGEVTAENYSGEVVGVNQEDYTGNGYGGEIT